MSSVLYSLPELYNSYKTWVSSNPQSASDFETTTKWISYFIAGRINNSHVLSELVYCLSNLLVLFNDRIINNIKQIELPRSGDTLKLWLTVVEYSEVFFELSVSKMWGITGKWVVIVAIQVFKCISRLYLIFHHKEAIIQNPPIPILQRQLLQKNKPNATFASGPSTSMNSSFTLKRSGKVIRSVEAAPPLALRDWKPLHNEELSCDNEQTLQKALAGRQLVAETIYIIKPLVHIGSMACFGNKSWKPWTIALVLDLTSLHLYSTCKKTHANSLNVTQKLQLSRRTIVLLLYLIRSPFYERHSKSKIEALLNSISRNIPLARLICGPLAQYLPFWQSNYFYMWTT